MPNTFAQAFIPEVWHKQILTELEKKLRFVKMCTREFEGDVRSMGDTVHILGLTDVTVNDIDLASKTDAQRASALAGITTEGVAGSEQTLTIDKLSYFSFKVNDVDKRQSLDGLMSSASQNASYKLADKLDVYASTITAASTTNLITSTSAVPSASAFKGLFDECVVKLMELNVDIGDCVATLSPRAFNLLRDAVMGLDTNNSDFVINGVVGRYNGVQVQVSNNVKKAQTNSAGDTDILSFRTKRAVAFVNQLQNIETLRSQTEFADIVRGQCLYGCKVVRPNELVNLKVLMATA